jgi:hypothetical protein
MARQDVGVPGLSLCQRSGGVFVFFNVRHTNNAVAGSLPACQGRIFVKWRSAKWRSQGRLLIPAVLSTALPIFAR